MPGNGSSVSAVYDTQVTGSIIQQIENGTPIKVAAEFAGISGREVLKWLNKGRRGLTPRHEWFYTAVQRARAVWEKRLLARIEKDDSWQSNAWLLERRVWQRYRRRDHTEIKHRIIEPPPKLKHVVQEIKEVIAEQQASQQRNLTHGSATNGTAGHSPPATNGHEPEQTS